MVGQIGSGHILVDDPLAAWIVDQHVAHERALLDRLTDPEDEQMPTVQSLLVPEVVELPPQDAAEAAHSLEELSATASRWSQWQGFLQDKRGDLHPGRARRGGRL